MVKNLNQILELVLFDTQTSFFPARKEMKRESDSVSNRKQVKELYMLHKIFEKSIISGNACRNIVICH